MYIRNYFVVIYIFLCILCENEQCFAFDFFARWMKKIDIFEGIFVKKLKFFLILKIFYVLMIKIYFFIIFLENFKIFFDF